MNLFSILLGEPDEREIKDILIKEGSIRKRYYIIGVMKSCMPKDKNNPMPKELDLCFKRLTKAKNWGVGIMHREEDRLKTKYRCLRNAYLKDDLSKIIYNTYEALCDEYFEIVDNINLGKIIKE